MAEAVAAAAAAIATAIVGAGAAAAGTATFVAVESAVDLALTLGIVIGADLLLQPKIPAYAQQQPLKQGTPPRRFGFGQTRVGGYYMLFEALKSDAFDVLAIHEGKIAGFTGARWFLNDDEVSLGARANNEQNVITPDSVKYGHNSDHVYVDFRVGDFPNTSYAANSPNVLGAGDPTILPAESWDDSFRGDGIASIALRYVADSPKKQSGTFPNGAPQPSVAPYLLPLYDPRLNGSTSMGDPSTWNWSHNSALCLLAFLVDPRSFSMGLSFARRIAPTIQYWINAANVCDSQVEVASVSTHTLEAETGGAVNHLKFANVNGLKPGITVTVGVNSADEERLTVASIGGSQGPGEVFFTTNIVNSHPSGDEVQWGGGGDVGAGTEDRYRCNGVAGYDQAPADIISQINGTMDGWLGMRGDGALTVFAGQYYEPTVILSDAHVLDYSVQQFQADEEVVNQLLPTYTEPNYKYNTVDAGQWDSLHDQQQRGRIRSKQMQLPWADSTSQARRLAKAQMARQAGNGTTPPLRGWVRTTLAGMNALGERYIRLQISENQLLHDIVVEINKGKIDLKTLSVTWQWVQADPTAYDWLVADEVSDNPLYTATFPGRIPNLGLPAPTIESASPVFVAGGAQIDITAISPLGAGVDWIVQWRVTGTTTWTSNTLTDVADGSPVDLLSGFVPAGGVIDVEVAYLTAANESPFSNIVTVDLTAGAMDGILDDFGASILDNTGAEILDDT